MFREEYIKANEQIKPDDDFLRQLKENIQQENKIVRIGEYIDYENADMFSNIAETYNDKKDITIKEKKCVLWKKMTVLVACFALVCTMVFVVSKVDLFGAKQGLQAGMESVVDGMKETEDLKDNIVSKESVFDANYLQKYEKAYDLFKTSNVVIYETEQFELDGSRIEYLHELQKKQCELAPAERDDLVGRILAKQYTLCDSSEEFKDSIYYVAEFEDGSCVFFVIGANEYIYIEEVSGIQSLALK